MIQTTLKTTKVNKEKPINIKNNFIYKREIQMTFTFCEWKLYKKEITTFNRKKYPFYFFCKGTPRSGKPSDMPDGYIMNINKGSKMPYLKFSGEKDSTWQKRKRKEYTK